MAFTDNQVNNGNNSGGGGNNNFLGFFPLDPSSPPNGTIWYNTTTASFKGWNNGSITIIGTSPVVQNNPTSFNIIANTPYIYTATNIGTITDVTISDTTDKVITDSFVVDITNNTVTIQTNVSQFNLKLFIKGN